MNFLIIAPETKGLFVPDVQQLIANLETSGIHGELVAGKLTVERVRACLTNQYDVLVWYGHGLPGLLQLYETAISARWLKDRLERCPRIKLVMLISCFGALRQTQDVLSSFTDALPALGIDVIAMGQEVSEKTSLVYTVNFLVKYVESGDARAAHAIALDQLLVTPGTAAEVVTPELHRGDTVVTTASLEDRMSVLESQAAFLLTQFRKLQRRQSPPNLVVALRIVFYFLVGSLFLSLTFEEVRVYYIKNPLTSMVILILALALLGTLATLIWFILKEDA